MSHQFDTVIVVNDTEIPVNVEFDYQPEEAQTYFYPGAKASVEINSVKIGDSEIPDYITACFTKDLEIDALEYLERINEGYADYLYDASREKRYA